MKNIKNYLVPLFIMTLLVLGACGNESASSEDVSEDESGSTGETISMRLGSHLANDHSGVETAEEFATILEEKSDGRITVSIHPNSELGGQRELIESLQLGTLEMSINDPGLLTNFYAPVGILDLPYVFRDYDHARTVLDGPVGETLNEGMLDVDLRSLGWFDSAFRNVLLNQEIESVDELQGLKIRTPDAPSVIQTVESWGAAATPMDWGEIFTGLQTGVVDGMEGSAESVYSANMHEVTDYYVMTEHIYTPISMNISNTFFESLSEEDQALIQEAADEAIQFGRQLAEERDEEYTQLLLDGGMEAVEIDTEPLIEEAQNIQTDLAEEYDAVDLLEQIKDTQ